MKISANSLNIGLLIKIDKFDENDLNYPYTKSLMIYFVPFLKYIIQWRRVYYK